jgi:hypothetical protein
MSADAGVAITRKVWATEYEPLFVETAATRYVKLSTKNVAGHEFWGHVDLNLPAAMARELGKALIACADESEAA